MPKRVNDKKSEMIEVRIPHAQKEAFQRACEAEGITVSHAVRTFIDAYLKRSRRMQARTIAKDIAAGLLQRPVKSSAGLVGGAAAIIAGLSLIPTVSHAGDYLAPIDHAVPVYPEAMIDGMVSASCESNFDINPSGYVINLSVKCGHPGFLESARQAISALRFEPKIVDGVAVAQTGISYPLDYHIQDEEGELVPPLLPK